MHKKAAMKHKDLPRPLYISNAIVKFITAVTFAQKLRTSPGLEPESKIHDIPSDSLTT